MKNKKDYWLLFSKIEKDKAGITRLLKELGYDVTKLFEMDDIKLKEIGATQNQIEIINEIKKINVEGLWGELRKKDIKFISMDDKDYPSKLLQYTDFPLYFFYKGKLPNWNRPIVAMVGARACSNYGRIMAKNIGEMLSLNGIQVISGMARGIDTYSQLGSLNGTTPTFAVLGSGVDICYPTENIELYEEIIAKSGGIISEYWPGTAPKAWHFPMRNRIISGMSDLIAVIEAKEKSGSLITVEWALEQGKDILAMPGRVDDELSKGCNKLIKSGAGVLTCVEDVLELLRCDLGVTKKSTPNVILEELEERIYQMLELYPMEINEILTKTEIGYEDGSRILLKLQMLGLVEETYKNYYSRIG